MPALAVVACSRCNAPWTVELRNATSTCPRCQKNVDLRRRRRLWEGDAPEDARQATAAISTALAQGRPFEEAAQAVTTLQDPAPVPKHDSPVDAAAAKARGITNKSDRAEAVLQWLTELEGTVADADALAALQKAGLTLPRAEKEIVRMLASDVIFEPRAGWYQHLRH